MNEFKDTGYNSHPFVISCYYAGLDLFACIVKVINNTALDGNKTI